MNLFLAFLVWLLPLGALHAASPRETDWQTVEQAVNRGLPRTALEALEPILRAALAERAWPEATRALCRKITLEAELQGNRPEEKIIRLQAKLASVPREMRPLLETVLAHWYWQYFQQNRWRFLSRSTTATPPGEDFTTWDLRRLYAEIDRHFTAALEAEDWLKTTPVSAFDGFLARGSLPDRYRPTLYDFIVHEALAFYTSGEQAGARPQDAFEVSAEDPIFDLPEQFLAWRPATTETNAAAYRAVRLYQDLLRFHQRDADPTAFLDADLARLVWGRNAAGAEGRDERFKAALLRFAEQHAAHELSARALHLLAERWWEEGNPAEAHRLARRGRDTHPESPGGKLCANLLARIEAPSVSLTTERIWNAPWPALQVRYRNVTQVWFRAVEWNWEDLLKRGRGQPTALTEVERQELLAQTPALEWSAPLPPTTDFKERVEQLPAPTGLRPGFYFLIASHQPDFRPEDNQLALADIWVSDLALVLRQRSGRFEGLVLEAASGEPIAGARVQGWQLDARGHRVALPEVLTDTNGLFTLRIPENRGVLIQATARGQSVASADAFYRWRAASEPPAVVRALLFTDRAIYRPGQILQYKGICLRAERSRDAYETLAGVEVIVSLRDVNGQEIGRQLHRANDYGSFSGSFTLPRDRLTGTMELVASQTNQPVGNTSVRVEEYKRPRFQVTLDPPRDAARLGGQVRLTGQAMAYTGAAVDGAEVCYRVTRQVRLPWWWGWRGGRFPPPPAHEAREIAHGTLRTDGDGRFEITFVARPDPTVPETDEPVFEFEAHAEVTDGAGETRSDARVVRLGYAALEARLTAPDWLTDDAPVRLEVRTTSLDGEPQSAAGTLKVHLLQAPARVQRPPLPEEPWIPLPARADGEEEADLSDPVNWPLGPVVVEHHFATDTNGVARIEAPLAAGAYRAVLETRDAFGRAVTGRLPLLVLSPGADRLALRVPQVLAAPTWEVQPGDTFLALWGTGYNSGRALVEIEHRGRIVQRYWTAPDTTQAHIRHPVTEAMRGGFNLLVTFVRENRAYLTARQISVPWRDRELELRWGRFTSKLEPGQRETWTLEIRSPRSDPSKVERLAAELVATLYDASLDAFAPLHWPGGFGVFRQEPLAVYQRFVNGLRPFQVFHSGWSVREAPVDLSYWSFPPELGLGRIHPGKTDFRMMLRSGITAPTARGGEMPEMVQAMRAAPEVLATPAANAAEAASAEADRAGAAPPPRPDLSRVAARRIFNETAFFFPHLVSDSNGVVRLEFTLPEALTEWRFLGFAHDRQLRAGLLEGRAVTARDLMVQPNPPRFLREGDVIEFAVKVSNQSDQRQTGRVRLTFTDGLTEQPADALLGNTTPERDFDIPARASRSFAWRLKIPAGLSVLTYKAVAASASVSDGEEGFVPVLARRVLVTQSLPLPIRGPDTRRFEFKALAESGRSPTLAHQSLTVQVVSQPAWYAVLALPYLMESPHEGAEQVFNRYYANALARHIANADPKIRRVFELWKNTPALDSPLEKNQDLKSVVLEESPWVRQAQDESRARRNVGILFDDNRLADEQRRALDKLREMALPEGGWAWFPGGPRNDYITLYLVAGFGRLRHLGVGASTELARQALGRLDVWGADRHARILKDHRNPEDYVPDPLDALYLYGRSFFLKDQPLAAEHRPAVDFFLARARAHWLKAGNRQTQGHLALALHRFGDTATATAIARSLLERSVTDDELGRFWRDLEPSWWWYHAPIETQALMIEVFAEIARDDRAVEECQVWLLKQKQTQNWKTTKATADAVYALLLRGRNLLASDALVEVSLGGINVTPAAAGAPDRLPPPGEPRPIPEPGAGFYEVRFPGPRVTPELARITVRKTDPGVAWGSVHWQYFEDVARVPAHTATPLKLTKTLFTRRNTPSGPVLAPVGDSVSVGEELVVRLELRVDRDMEFVHLKDARGSGTEPVTVLSGYRHQDGLGYYESTRDTASHFFISYLRRGTYVFEYALRVQLRGRYQTGMASIQCLYAPEFNSHSESHLLVIQ